MATVLIVEDQAQIRYITLSAHSADDALVILAGPEPVDALFVDIVLNGDMQAGIELDRQGARIDNPADALGSR